MHVFTNSPGAMFGCFAFIASGDAALRQSIRSYYTTLRKTIKVRFENGSELSVQVGCVCEGEGSCDPYN